MDERRHVIALLPMKGHSERVPNKNLRAFAGKPLYHHIMETLLACPLIERVVVDTDSEPIADDVQEHFRSGADILWRPEAIRGDVVSMNRIIAYDLSQCSGTAFLQTHSTNPLLKASTVRRAIERFLEPGPHDSLFGVTRLQARCYDAAGAPVNHRPEEMLRTQDLPPVYLENSNLYLFSRASFAAQGRRIGERPVLFEIGKLEAIDIDDELDFRLAERLAQCQPLMAAAEAGVRGMA